MLKRTISEILDAETRLSDSEPIVIPVLDRYVSDSKTGDRPISPHVRFSAQKLVHVLSPLTSPIVVVAPSFAPLPVITARPQSAHTKPAARTRLKRANSEKILSSVNQQQQSLPPAVFDPLTLSFRSEESPTPPHRAYLEQLLSIKRSSPPSLGASTSSLPSVSSARSILTQIDTHQTSPHQSPASLSSAQSLRHYYDLDAVIPTDSEQSTSTSSLKRII